METAKGPFIDGKICAETRERMEIVNPATEEVWADVGGADVEDVESAVTGAHRAFEKTWRDMKPGRRAEILFNIARLLREKRDEIALLDVRSVGKPISDA